MPKGIKGFQKGHITWNKGKSFPSLRKKIKKCLFCKKDFQSYIYKEKLKIGKFCSKKCFADYRKKRINRLCPNCEKEIIVNPYRLKNKWGTFCSHQCYTNWIKKVGRSKGENNPNWKGGMSERQCFNCKKSFFRYNGRKEILKFCSWKCSNIFHGRQNYITMRSRFQFEYKAIWELRKEGYFVCRSAGSRGPFDILALKNPNEIRFIQIKSTLAERANSNISSYVKAIKELFLIPTKIAKIELWIWILREKHWVKIDCSSWSGISLRKIRQEIKERLLKK